MSLFAFIVAALVLAFTPGPGIARVVARTVAKAAQGQWLASWQVVISTVVRMVGDGRLADRLPVAQVDCQAG